MPRFLSQIFGKLFPQDIKLLGTSYLEKSRWVAIAIFVLTAGAIVYISYAGVDPAQLPVLPGQVATLSLNATVPFSFESREQTRLQSERYKTRVPPVYQLSFAAYQRFETHIHELLGALEKYLLEYPPGTPSLSDRRAAFAELVDRFNQKGPYRANPDDVAVLLQPGVSEARALLTERCLVVLQEIYREGIQDTQLSTENLEPGAVAIFQIAKPDGEIIQRPVQTLEEALIFLRVNLTAEGMPRETAHSLFRLFRNGLTPNLVFDPALTQRRETEAVKNLRPVTVRIEKGQAILEAGKRVSQEQYEMLIAHREALRERGEGPVEEAEIQFFARLLMVLGMVAACVIYIRIEDPDTLRSNGRLALLATVVVVNLALVRLTYSLLDLEFFTRNPTWAATLPFFAPTAMAPLIVAILIDAGSGIFMALFISLFTGVIYGNRIDVQVVTFLASMVAIFGCHARHRRSRVIRAGFFGGLIVSATTLLLGLVEQTPIALLSKQMAAGALTGLLTGVAVVGLLPLLESLFRRTTDITLLELTDYNHPLLRLMQMETPGTYHHSLVVAQLAENAAAAVGANPLLARVCALYHDIGKTRNPGYFAENQGDADSPHEKLTPLDSVRFIRQHVADGVELARRHRLPKAVVEVIQQHHGTTVIRYFLVKQRQTQQGQAAEVPEQAFRYEGPTPDFKESAIIALADTIEAAARSLKQVTEEGIERLIDELVRERLQDGQLDRAPLTLAELATLKQSYATTLMNMLHSRIEYPK